MLQCLETSDTFRVLVYPWNLFMCARFQSDNFSSQLSDVPWIYLCLLRDSILLLKVVLIVRYLQAFQVLVSVSDCEISAGLSNTGVSVWLWDICRPFKYWCQCLIVRYLQAFQVLASVSDISQRKLLLPALESGLSFNKVHQYKIYRIILHVWAGIYYEERWNFEYRYAGNITWVTFEVVVA